MSLTLQNSKTLLAFKRCHRRCMYTRLLLVIHHFLLGRRDAEEAMLAAAIRASLIEAGEPDTSIAAPPNTSQQHDSTPTPDKHLQQQQQQQQAGPQASPFQTSEREQQSQQQQPAQPRRQQQKQKGQHQLRFQKEDLPDGHGLPLQHDSALEQFRDSAAVMQDTGSVGVVGQGTSQRGSRQACSVLQDGQLRTAWSSDGIGGRGNSEDVPEFGAGDAADVVSYSPQSSC